MQFWTTSYVGDRERMHKKVHSKITENLEKAYKNVGGLDVPIPLDIVSLLVEFNHFNDLN